jgi:hypothetical protein
VPLSGGDGANNQPDDEQHRSDTHCYLRRHIRWDGENSGVESQPNAAMRSAVKPVADSYASKGHPGRPGNEQSE